MTWRRLILLPSLLLLVAAASPPLRYVLDKDSSAVTAKVAYFGIASKTVRFPSMKGAITIVPDRITEAKVEVTIDARELDAPDEFTAKNLKGKRFFWVEKYPTLRFVGNSLTMSDQTHGTVKGKLTARGITRDEELSLTFDTPPVETSMGDPITLNGELVINRRDYGMKAFPLIVGKMVKVHMEARMLPLRS